ncbi:dimethyl sulfoxide reductase anchor subunit [Octadecabacter sp. 1_MG-2023]|uniref:dimethyl sulfoxide reductase anchor subunit family protein n=1 Tax=unclassified Octadecabacter TaxID=196158 RepID=UPI001C08BD6E|nr:MULTISPECIES: DmsC/YnfH family molybdoenzyme membrane anchor subunit [unclassified Octadecabacter]MBU2994255.1 dimethyl sulfoxide reductase anchor subunit [Octadecabacter sp. B2R22]MDO6734456.1 dimethyl sulfoxide reductase anchor subunit [Octadecabacter sp. 1_MG-2023]
MHPAPSVILFSTLSGAGFGLLAFLGFGLPAVTGWAAFGYFTLAYLLAVGGLIASTFHLGHPERAMKAFKQWRSSWLSREGICAVAALIVMAIYGAGLVFFDMRIGLLGIIGAILSFGTVFTTSMIYAQIKTVPRWNNTTTPAMFLSLCIAGGALLAGEVKFAVPLLILAAAAQIGHWLFGDRALADSGTTLATATGLGARGEVRAFEPPHTGTNYLLNEFVYVIGRKHALKLRIIALVLMIVVPLVLVLLGQSFIFVALAATSHLVGVFTARWLFFAQAEHVVGLYYGKR